MSRISLKRFWSRASKTNRQKALSFNNNAPMYSAPRCSMNRKHLEFGEPWDKATSSSMPTSPLGFVLVLPPFHTQTGGQLRIPLYIISGCSRSNTTRKISFLGPSFVYYKTGQTMSKWKCQIYEFRNDGADNQSKE